ncbi:MAG: DUF4097 family beta strand repeat-containing protein [Candidatus Eisenbacteria bacterium]
MRGTCRAALLVLASAHGVLASGGEELVLDYSAEGRPFPAAGKIVVRCERGSVRVAGDPEADRIYVRALEEALGAAGEESRAILDATTIDIREEGDSLVRVEVSPSGARFSRKRSFLGRLFGSPENIEVAVALSIRLPERADVEVRTVRASVRVTGIAGRVSVETASGAVRLDEIAGEVRAATEAGSIGAEDITGPVDVRSVRGEIEVRRVTGPVRVEGAAGEMYVFAVAGPVEVKNISGEVVVARASGSLAVTTAGGPVELIRCEGTIDVRTRAGGVTVRDVGKGLSRCRIRTESGEIRVLVPERWDARVEARAGTGAIECVYPIDLKWISKEGFLGVAGEGREELTIESRSGGVRIVREKA